MKIMTKSSMSIDFTPDRGFTSQTQQRGEAATHTESEPTTHNQAKIPPPKIVLLNKINNRNGGLICMAPVVQNSLCKLLHNIARIAHSNVFAF